MTIVSVDPQRRMYLPKELGFKAKKAVIIPRGQTYILIPIPDEITPIDTQHTTQELRQRGEEKAEKETRDANRI